MNEPFDATIEENRNANVFAYLRGQYCPITNEDIGIKGKGEWRKVLHEAGFAAWNEVGTEFGPRYLLWERQNEKDETAPPDWIVEFCTGDLACVIWCRSWPDLIEVLGKISPIILAHVQAADFEQREEKEKKQR